MSKFFYTVRDNTGRKIAGTEEAPNSDELVTRLQARDLIVVNVGLDSNESSTGFGKKKPAGMQAQHKHTRVTSGDLVVFCRQLSTLLSAGVTILKSLDIISKQVSSRKFYATIKDLQKNMEGGLTFNESMGKHPAVFSELWVNLAESGEASGNLAVILNRLATYLERKEAFKKKIISALIYPIILMLAGFGALLFLTIQIIPTFADLFKGFNITLPALTQLLITVSVILRKYGFLILAGIIISGFLLKKYINTKDGRRAFEVLQYKLPVAGDFFRAMAVERFSSSMSTLIESGVPLLYSLEITEHTVGSMIVGEIIRQVKTEVRDGKTLSQPLEETGFFEPMVVQMIAVGEEIGDLPQMFKRINTFYEEYITTTLERFVSVFEPAVLVFMGAMIGVMVVGMFLPIFQLSQIGQ